MAKTGLLHPVAAKIKSEVYGQLPTYDEGVIIGRAITVDMVLNYGNNPFYADNREVNNDTDFVDGTLTVAVDEFGKNSNDSFKVENYLLGGKLEEATDGKNAVLHSGGEVNSPYVGFGYMKSGQYPDSTERYYEAVWLHRVRFTPTGESSSTKAGSTTWSNPSITGRIYVVAGVSGGENLMKKERFATEKEAVEWLDGLAGVAAEADTTTTDPATSEGSDDL